MFARPVRNDEATGLVVRPGACVVRLRTSPVERLLLVLRTILGVAFGIGALWLGGVFLSCTASTAAAVPVQTVVYGAVKGGKDRAAGGRASGSSLLLLSASGDGEGDSDGGDSDSGNSDSSDSSDSGSDSDGDSHEKSSSDSDKSDSDKSDSDKSDSDKSDSDKKESDKKDSDENESEKNEAGKKESDDSSSESEKRDSDGEKAGTSESRGEQSDEEKPAAAEHDGAGEDAQGAGDDSEDKDSEAVERSDSQHAQSGAAVDQDDAADDERAPKSDASDESDGKSADSGSEVDGDADEGDDVSVAAVRDEARESYDKISAEQPSSDTRESRDEDDSEGADSEGSDLESSDVDAADLAESAADLAEGIGDEATEGVRDLVEGLTRGGDDEDGDADETGDRDATSAQVREVQGDSGDQASETDERSDAEEGSESVDVLAAKVTDLVDDVLADADVRAALEEASDSDSDDARSDAEDAQREHLFTEAANELAAAADQDTPQARLRAGDPADPRGPPAETVSLLSSDESDEDESRESDEDEDRDDRDDDKDYDDSPELTEQVLEDRIEVDNSKEELEQEKSKVASGETSQADYDKKAAEHAERERKAAENRDELSPDRVELVDEVVDGHNELSKRESELDAEEQQVASGAVDRATHEKNVADYEKRRDDVYDATDELMDATDREVRTVSEDDLDGEGAAAGCDGDGAFVACGSASESADGERDSERKLCLSGVSNCGASSESGGSKAEASCDDTGCGSSATSRGADGTETRSSARCDGAARDCGQSSKADREGASAECESGSGTCRSESNGSGRGSAEPGDGRDTVRLASADEPTETRVAGSSSAQCESATGCGTSSRVEVGEDGDVVADAETGCDTGCTGSASTRTDASVVAATSSRQSTTAASADCSVNGGSCSARSDSKADGEDGDLSASSTAGGSVDCDTACTGNATGTTSGKTTGSPAVAGAAAPVRETTGTSSCTASAGGCSAESASEVGDVAAESRSVRNAARELYATSAAGSGVACATQECSGTGTSTTTGAASGDVIGVRDSTGTSSCSARGAGGTCSTAVDTLVSDREPTPGEIVAGVVPVSGPVSVSNATASVECTGAATECGGTATSATSARDTAITPDARGTSASTECAVTGGGCAGTAGSAASSANDFVATDPNTGLPLPGQPATGPSSTATAHASLACAPGTSCTGSVRTSTSAWDGALTRTSDGTASCTGATGGCDVQSVSTASSGPGAALALAGGPQPVNAARLPAGPSAASAAGAAMTCAGELACTGSVSSAANATDPLVSPAARGSHGEGSCEGVTGGVCQAVTNSAASSDPSANVIAPLVAERSTANATVTSGTTGDAPQGSQPQQEQPAAPVPTAPGSSANSGAPTVPGASSWTMANATLDCSGSANGCTGVARSSAAGSDGPATGNGVVGARGPPAGGSSTSSSCATGVSGCRAQTSATAASGQVVADMIAEDRISTAVQLAEQAAQAEYYAALAARVAGRADATAEQKKAAADAAAGAEQARVTASEAAELAARPVTGAPAVTSESSAGAHCAGAGCTAATTGSTTGTAGASTTTATCTAAGSGCAVGSDATASPGAAQTTSRVACPEAGCTAALTGTAHAVAELGGQQSRSSASGDTGCSGATACEAQISAGSTVAVSGPDAATSASVGVTCADGSATGCATRASSQSHATGAAGVHATSTATCGTAGACQAVTSGYVTTGVAEVMASCAGTGCVTHTDGDALHTGSNGRHSAKSRTDCTAGVDGQCAGTSRVGATDGSTQVSANCQASAGSTCSYSFSASSTASSATGGMTASADATCGASGGAGGGWCATSATAETNADLAVAMAECQGSANAGCSYRYEATASKSTSHPSGSWAKARAHGSGTGGFGSGGVVVSAKVLAEDGHAYAEATCAGAPNCSTHYEAEAYAAGHFDDPQAGGTWDSWGRPRCVGGGSSGGGCGVIAIAEPGYGGGQCYGSYSSCQTPGDSVFTPYAPPPGYFYDENGNLVPESAPIGEMGEPVRSVDGKCLGFFGLCTVSAMGQDGKVVQKVCWIACTAETTTGEKASYNIFTGFDGQMSTTPGGSANDVAHGRDTVHIARDADGDGEASATGGNWYITDGHTGTTTRAHSGNVRVPNPGGSARLSNPSTGSPFKVTCTGPCEWNRPSVPGLPGGDKITIDRAWSEITGRDAAGGPGKIQFDGKGHFQFTSAEGITISAESQAVDAPRATIYTPSNGHQGSFDIKDQMFTVTLPSGYSVTNVADRAGVWGNGRLTAHGGTGGKLYCSGDCAVTRPGEPSATYLPFVTCKNCRLGEGLPGEDPTRPNGWGEVELYDFSNGPVTRMTTNGGVQTCEGKGCKFTQFNPDAQGNGGGAICETGDGGGQNKCSGSNRFGDIQEALGTGRVTGLRYRNNDGTAGGRFCAESSSRGYCGEGTGGDVRGNGPWDVAGVMTNPGGGAVAAYDPNYKLPEDVAAAVAEVKNPDGTPVVPRAEGDKLRPLTEIELEKLRKANPAAADAYERGRPAPSQMQRHGAIFASLEDKSDIAEVHAKYGESVSSTVTDFESAVAHALADNWIDDAEWGQIAPLKGAIDEAAPGLLKRWLPAAERSSLMEYANYRGATLNDNARWLVHENPEVVSDILDVDIKGKPSAEQQQLAVDKILEGQQKFGDASLALSHALGTRPVTLKDRTETYNQRVDAANKRGYLLPGEREWFKGELTWLEGEQAALGDIDRQHRPVINEANGILRDLDLVYVSASGNTNWKVDLTLANGQLDLSQELQNRLAAPKNAREQGLADTFGGVSTLGQLNYNAIRDRQYSTISSFLTEVRLPSSGYPDMAYVHAAAAALPKLDQHYQGSDQQLSRVWANLSGDEKTRIAASSVDLGNVAAKPNFTSWENAFLSSAANVAWAKSLQPGQDLNGDGKADTDGFQDWFVRGHELPDDWEAWTKNLSDSERAKLEEVYRNNRQSVLVAVGDNVSGFLDRGVDWINDPFGDRKDRPKDFLSVARDDFKGIITGIPRMATQGVENGLTELGTWSQIAVGSMGAVLTGDSRVLQNALPTGGDWSSKFPITTGAVQNAEGFLDRWGSAIQGDTSKLRATYGQGKIASTLAQDLGAILPFAAMFRRVPKELSTTMRGVTGPLTRPNRLELPSLVPGTMVGPTRTGLGDIGHLALGPLTSLRPRPLNDLGDLAGSVQRALPQRAPRIVDEKFRAEVGARSIDELTSGLRGDPRFHVWEYAGQTFVRRGHPDESWMRNELGDAPHDRTGSAGSLFDDLVKENRAIRDTEYTAGANRKIKNKWPERTVSTGRASGTVNGRPFDEKIAVSSGEAHLLKGTGGENLPALPPDGHLIFKTREFENTSRKYDSEPKAFEKLARDILAIGSGQSRQAVEDAIVAAIERAPKTTDGYPVNAKDVIDDAAARLGVDLDDINISVDMVIDFPRGLREMTPDRQVCGSCQSLMDDFEKAFRDKVTIRARNLNGETLW